METINVKISQLKLNAENPRTITEAKLNKLIDSILVFPKMLNLRQIVVDDKMVALGGNMRLKALRNIEKMTHDDLAGRLAGIADFREKSQGEQQAIISHWVDWLNDPRVEAIRASSLSEAERKQFIIKDNVSFGAWDFDRLANKWDESKLCDWGMDVWNMNPTTFSPSASSSPSQPSQYPSAPDIIEEDGACCHEFPALSTKGLYKDDDYKAFEDKFQPKLTTDDCYTPSEVYDAVIDFVDRKVAPLSGRVVVRPFKPDGNYQDLSQYPNGCVVVDNPPFSIFREIVEFYLTRGINFFLFGPQLTLFNDLDCCFCPFNLPIRYENGANVATGFVTDLVDARVWVESSLRERIVCIQKNSRELGKYRYPEEFISSATIGTVSRGGNLMIKKNEARFVKNLDYMRENGKGVYGGGFLLSRAAAERAAAERAAEVVSLSEREIGIISELDGTE